MNALPAAIANGYIHIGTMQGKLNGVMPTQTPRGWRMLWESIPLATFSSDSPIIKLGMPHGDFDHLNGTADFGFRVIKSFAVFARKSGGEFDGMFFEQVFELVERLYAVNNGYVAPFEEGGVRGFDGAIDILQGGVGNLGDDFAAGGIDDVVEIPTGRFPLAIDQETCAGDCCFGEGHTFSPVKDIKAKYTRAETRKPTNQA